MSAITAGTGTVYSEVKDNFLQEQLYRGIIQKSWLKQTGWDCLRNMDGSWLFRTLVACFGLTCGAPYALCRCVYVFAFKSRTKTFTATTNDNGIELFCREPDAMAVKSIVIRNNEVITVRAISMVGRCFWITKLDLSGCENLKCGSLVCACLRGCMAFVDLMNPNP